MDFVHREIHHPSQEDETNLHSLFEALPPHLPEDAATFVQFTYQSVSYLSDSLSGLFPGKWHKCEKSILHDFYLDSPHQKT